ncbi:MAG TPA: YfhO family protein [Thermoanaerobaculia bacterium]|jgi:hypothetical protein|nr:YfhO family protein [Thermoanaerobaculia bacterium]
MLLVLQLLAVYVGTVAVALWLARRFILPVPGRVALFLALAPFLLTGRAMVTARLYAPADILYGVPPYAWRAPELGIGKALSPVLGDVVYQTIAWRKATRDAIKRGRLPLWNRFILAGEPLLAVQQGEVLHPVTWIGFLLPLPQSWTYEMAIRLFLALLCADLFFADLGLGTGAALLGACGWSFCDWLVFYDGYSLTAAMAVFPLLLLGLRRIAAAAPGREGTRAVAVTVVALVLLVLAGHPETLLHSVTGGGIYFLFELAWAGRQGWRRPLGRALLAGVLSLGLSAVQLLPFVEALPATVEHYFRTVHFAHLKRSLPLPGSVRRTATSAVPYAYGISGRGRGQAEIVEPSAYAGAVLLPFAILGLASRRRERWPLLVNGLFGLALFARFPGVTDALASLPLFDIGINDRLIFLTAFALAGLSALGAERLREEGGARLFVLAAAWAAVAMAVLFLLLRPSFAAAGLSSSEVAGRFALQMVPLLLALAAVALLGQRRAGLAVASGIVLLLAQRGLEAGSVYPTLHAGSLYPRLPAFDHIPPQVPWRITALAYTFLPNTPAFYGLEDVRGYEAMTLHRYFDTYPLWCQHQPVWFNRVDDASRPFLSFLNVRWVFAAPGSHKPPGWTLLHEDAGGLLFENPKVLPRAFVPREVWREPDPAREISVLRQIADYGERGVVSATAGGDPARTWLPNGRAAVRIARYDGQEMEMDVAAAAAALVATSTVDWPGWRLTLDGRPAPTVSYNHAFVGFRVPPGRHRAVLTYLPVSFVGGAGVSLASLAVGIFLLGRSRRREGPGPGRAEL